MKRVNWHIPEAAGVNVWPNVSSTRHELRSQVRSGQVRINLAVGSLSAVDVMTRFRLRPIDIARPDATKNVRWGGVKRTLIYRLGQKSGATDS